MEAPFAPPYEFKVLDGVCDVGLLTRNSGFGQSLVEQASRGPDKRPALPIFLIAGLLAYKNNLYLRRSLTEDRLSGLFVEITSFTGTSGIPQSVKGTLRRKKIFRRTGLFLRFGCHQFQRNNYSEQIQVVWYCRFCRCLRPRLYLD